MVDSQGGGEWNGGKSLGQPPALVTVLRKLDVARRQLSLYGNGHPNTSGAFAEAISAITEYISQIGPATCIFAKEAVIINDRFYQSSTDSKEMFSRLRARGVLAVTFVTEPTLEQIKEFAGFLNAEPREIKREGGPVAYLRRRAVTRITVTEAVYTDDEVPSKSVTTPQENLDHAVAAAIRWLSKEESTEEEENPQLPIREILSDPDMAARLIREAVTKLHVSRRTENTNELANEVVLNMKSLTGDDQETWDEVAPQVRKAISKLPRNLRPVAGGLAALSDDTEDTAVNVRAWKSVDTLDVEIMVADVIKQKTTESVQNLAARLDGITGLFGVKATGLPSSWTTELRPDNVMRSTGGTFTALMSYETGPTEHNRIAHALASLIPNAIEMGDLPSALQFTENLTSEIRNNNKLDWRAINSRAALSGVGMPMLRNLLDQAIKSGKYEARAVASTLVETLPELAVNAIDLLGRYSQEAFNDSLKEGLKSAGQAALGSLGKVLRTGSPTAVVSALETLTEIGSASAVREISDVLDILDPDIAARSLKLLSSAGIPLAVEVATRALSRKAIEVRCAALWALGEMRDESALPNIIKIASHKSIFSSDNTEKIAAVEALGKIGGAEALECLTRIANHKPLFGREKYEPVHQAAKKAVESAPLRTAA